MPGWTNQKVYSDSQTFFAELKEGLKLATTSIDLEYYIFEWDKLGLEIIEILKERAQSGVQVRVCVDGIGSYHWASGPVLELPKSNVQTRIFHPVPWPLSLLVRGKMGLRQRSAFLFSNLNRRNHKKACIIDEEVAYVGSNNISSLSLKWRETAVRVSGVEVKNLAHSFEDVWRKSDGAQSENMFQRLKKRRLLASVKSRWVRLNQLGKLRRQNFGLLLREIQSARTKVWITNAYFVPTPRLVTALVNASQKGIEVRVVLPGVSDIRLVRWVSQFFYRRLISAGVQIFEFKDQVLHAKTILFDEFALVGSSNLNHRSIYHDLEIDVVIDSKDCLDELQNLFEKDVSESKKIDLADLKKRPIFEVIMGRIFLLLKNWL